MEIDPKLLKQLIATFTIELDEQSHVLTEGLLKLEKADLPFEERSEVIKTIFRAAHNIKGAARGIGIVDIGELAHHIESLFTLIQQNKLTITSSLIDLCLETVDGMKAAMKAFSEKTLPTIDIQKLIKKLTSISKMQELPTVNEPQITLAPNPIIKTKEETIRVSLQNLDRVSAILEEMQINKIAIEDHYTELTKLLFKGKQLEDPIHEFQQLQKKLRPPLNDLDALSNALQEEIRLLRLIPASTLLVNFHRIVRDLAHELHKEVILQITGDQVKMDKMVLEGLKDPLIHLIRNAIDHGIEEADFRKNHGKNPVGTIQIDILEEGNQILFKIADDGAGIDTRKIAAIALQKKIISKDELNEMNETEIINLIFRPGFSSKEMITDVSGRGIGLDIVKANLAQLKGQVSVTTELGKSTIFYLRVPLTLSSARGVLLKSGGQLFVIPTHFVERVLLIKPKEVIKIQNSQAIQFDHSTIPLRLLAHILGIHTKQKVLSELSIIVISNDREKLALLVDEIIGEREIVIKPLQAPANNIPCVSGGTLSGNGDIIIVLNPTDLMKQVVYDSNKESVILNNVEITPEKRPHILVVDDSITTRTLEKNVLENKNYQVTVAVNGKEAWDLLQNQKFSLLITDISMPIMDGFTLTENVKKSKKLHDLPVIIVTSLDNEQEKKRGIEVGANAYIVKNEFESGVLLEIVSQLV